MAVTLWATKVHRIRRIGRLHTFYVAVPKLPESIDFSGMGAQQLNVRSARCRRISRPTHFLLKPNGRNGHNAVIWLGQVGKPVLGQRQQRKPARIQHEWLLPQGLGLWRTDKHHAHWRWNGWVPSDRCGVDRQKPVDGHVLHIGQMQMVCWPWKMGLFAQGKSTPNECTNRYGCCIHSAQPLIRSK